MEWRQTGHPKRRLRWLGPGSPTYVQLCSTLGIKYRLACASRRPNLMNLIARTRSVHRYSLQASRSRTAYALGTVAILYPHPPAGPKCLSRIIPVQGLGLESGGHILDPPAVSASQPCPASTTHKSQVVAQSRDECPLREKLEKIAR